MVLDTFIKFLRDLLDLLQTDGGHIAIALMLMFCGLIAFAHWQLAEGKELFIWALGVLGYAFKVNNGGGPKNGQSS